MLSTYNKKDAGTNVAPFKTVKHLAYITFTADALAEIYKEREESIHSGLQLGKMFEVSKSTVTIQLALPRHKLMQKNETYLAKQDGAIWRLAHKRDESSADEEVVASFQGILCRKEIAPYNEKTTWAQSTYSTRSNTKNPPLIRLDNKVKYLRQSATLTAFGNPVFEKPIENIAEIYAIFKRAVGDNLSESAVYSTYEGFPAIDVANRYFTPKGAADPEEIRPLTAEVDPNGYLAKAAGSKYVHTEENKVYYFEKNGNGRR